MYFCNLFSDVIVWVIIILCVLYFSFFSFVLSPYIIKYCVKFLFVCSLLFIYLLSFDFLPECVEATFYSIIIRNFRASLNELGVSLKNSSTLPAISQKISKEANIDCSIPDSLEQPLIPVVKPVALSSAGVISSIFKISPTRYSPKQYDKLILSDQKDAIKKIVDLSFSKAELKKYLDSASDHHMVIYEYYDVGINKELIVVIGGYTSQSEVKGVSCSGNIVETIPISVPSPDGVVSDKLFDLHGNNSPQYFSLLFNNKGVLIMLKEDYAKFSVTFDNELKKGAQVQHLLDRSFCDINKKELGFASSYLLKQVMPNVQFVVVPRSLETISKNSVSAPLTGNEGVD